jgi:hydroxymethylglutaryl-CoA lyase
MSKVEIVEVGPRDGLQNIPHFVPTETKVALIRMLLAAGFRRMELGSFVSPAAIPQMSNMDEVIAALGPLPTGVRGMALVPNAKGARRAIAAGITDLIFVISMSDSHNRSNVRRPTEASIEDLRTLLAEVDPGGRLTLRVGLATSYHCPFEGVMDEGAVFATIERIVALRDGIEFALSDTTGMALPHHVKSLAKRCIDHFGSRAKWCFHGHDTAGFGVANVLAALEAGITSFDSSVAGLGGCPFAPGATGNIASEDLVVLFERMGVETGIDIDRLLQAADMAAALPGAAVSGHARSIPRARLLGHGVPLVAEAA